MKKLFSILTLTIAFLSIGFVEMPKNSMVLNKAQAATVKQARAMHILVPTKEQALNIRKEILAGETKMEIFDNFRNAAMKYSKCPSGKSGGDLGWFGKGDMVPEFEQVVFSIPSGQVSEPVKTAYGWHLIYVISKK